MEDTDRKKKKKQRWSVTYTKRIKRKRKIYQDGFLDLHFSTNKVMLFDECEKLLECRILKDEEVVSSSETLTFNAFLVDVGDPEVGVDNNNNKLPVSDLNFHGRDRKITERFSFMRRQKFRNPSISSSGWNDNVEKNDARPDCLSTSQKIIRDIKKSELQRYGVPESSPDMSKSATEWQVLYSTQVTQKAKKYHDGFLQLDACGSLGRQVMLYDASKKLLTIKFLKPDEIVKSGGSVSLAGYLVVIGAPERDRKPLVDLTIQQNTCNIGGKTKTMHVLQSFKSNISVGKEWQVLYTTQMTQKTKKYHDGFLRLASCGSLGKQIMLYDASQRRLDCRFLKKEEMISSGESISFDAHLVDIGEPEGENQLLEDLNIQGNNSNDVSKPRIMHGQPNCIKGKKSVAREWCALYTSHITQKAKKYHSGILRLASCGSYRIQVTLLNEGKTILTSKFLSLSEDVKVGSMLALPKYLVEVGEPLMSSEEKLQNSSCSTKAADSNFSMSIYEEMKLCKIIPKKKPLQDEKYQNTYFLREDANSGSISIEERTKLCNAVPTNKTLRNACQILSILQKPVVQGNVAVRCIDKSINASTLSEDSELSRQSFPHEGPSQNLDVGGSSKIVDIEISADLNFSEVISTFRGNQFLNDTEAAGNYDQCHPANVEADIKCCDEAFASSISSLVGSCTHGPNDDKRKTLDQPKSARKMDEWPTFDLGF